MPHYQLFGGVLCSDVEFPELPSASGSPPRWTLHRLSKPPDFPAAIEAGREEVDAGVTVVLLRSGHRARLAFSDTGTFDVSADGCRIDWYPPANPDMEAVRKDILGRVFAVALEHRSILTLHGSAVALGNRAVAFLAPKFHGKSTTATALVNAGGMLLADDLVPVTPGPIPTILPSVPMVQLWKDSAEQVGKGASPLQARDLHSPKLQVAWDAPERTAAAAVSLAAVYLLAPVRNAPDAAVRRIRLAGAEAALALLGQAKIGALLGAERRRELLDRLTELAGRAPVYRLEIPRDFGRIDELTTALWTWHSAAGAAEESA